MRRKWDYNTLFLLALFSGRSVRAIQSNILFLERATEASS